MPMSTRLKTFLYLSLALLLPLFWTKDSAADSHLRVSATLDAFEPATGCGYLFMGSIARYTVITGPQELLEKQIDVVVPCAELPRKKYAKSAGDLISFEIGARHFLVLSRVKPKNLFYSRNQISEDHYYLEAAFINDVRKTSSSSPSIKSERAMGK